MKYVKKEHEYQNYIEQLLPAVLEFVCAVLQQPLPRGFALPGLSFSSVRRQQRFGTYHVHNVLLELERIEHREGSCAFLQHLATFLQGGDLQQWRALEAEFASSEDGSFSKATVALFAKCRQLLLQQPVQAVFTSENKIIFYEENIRTICAELGLSMETYLPAILVHELCHALHFAYVMEQQGAGQGGQVTAEAFAAALAYWSGTGYIKGQVRTVKETLARYMQYSWCACNLPQVAELMVQRHRGAYVIHPNWPYAGASSILSMAQEQGILCTRLLWKTSAQSWQEAYDKLKNFN